MNILKLNRYIENQQDKPKVSKKWLWLRLLVFCCIMPQQVFSQSFNPLISFSVETCTLDEALEKLFAEYELNVAFSKAELSKIRIESYSCSYKSVEEVLTDLLRDTGYGFKKVGKQYVIRKMQPFEPVAIDPQISPEKPPKGILEHKSDTIVSKNADTIRIFDTLKIVRTVMRYDTIVEQVVETDTFYQVKYKGYEIKWPDFRDNGWFVAPSLTLSTLKLDYEQNEEQPVAILAPIYVLGIGLDGGYKHNRLAVGMSLGYRSAKYSFSFNETLTEGDYYINDTLDTYYVVHPAGDTVFHYILDSTYVPLTTMNYAFRDVNRLDYLSVGMFASFDFVKTEHFRMFIKAGASMDFLLASSGSWINAAITNEQTESYRFAYFGGFGAAVKIGNHVELVPEVAYRNMVNSVYRTDFPLDLRMKQWDFRLGLTYYF